MNYSEIKYNDIANGPGVRTSLFVSGCRNHCPGCFNKETWKFDYGRLFTDETQNEILESLKSPYIEGLSILGGEPLEPENQNDILNLIQEVKLHYPSKSIWLWTGFTFEDIVLLNPLCRAATPIGKMIIGDLDVLVDGLFEESKKDLLLRFKGSSNQRIINCPLSILYKKPILWKDSPINSTHNWE